MAEGGPKLKLQEYVERRTSPVLRRCRQRVNCQRYEAKFDRAAADLSRWQMSPGSEERAGQQHQSPVAGSFFLEWGQGFLGVRLT